MRGFRLAQRNHSQLQFWHVNETLDQRKRMVQIHQTASCWWWDRLIANKKWTTVICKYLKIIKLMHRYCKQTRPEKMPNDKRSDWMWQGVRRHRIESKMFHICRMNFISIFRICLTHLLMPLVEYTLHTVHGCSWFNVWIANIDSFF